MYGPRTGPAIWFTMKNIKVNERSKRKIDEISDRAKIFNLVKAHLSRQPLMIKGDFTGSKVQIRQIDPKNGLILVQLPDDFQPPEEINFYKVLGRYVELEGKVVGTRGSGNYIIRVEKAKIASFARAHPRYNIRSGEAYVTHIRTAKNVINASMFNIPTSVKVHFSQASQQYKHLADIVKIDTFGNSKDEKLELVRKSKKVLWVEDTQDVASYIPENEDFVDYQTHLGIDIGETMKDYMNRGIKSEMICPVIYIGFAGESIPLGYIQIQSKSEHFDQLKFLELKELTFNLVDKIRDSNTMTINERQRVLDMSVGGLRLEIDHPDLKEALQHQAGFTFDVIFKMQQPLTFFGKIRSTYTNPSNNLVVGVQIQGSSSRKGESERYTEYINTLIAPNRQANS